ncbi:MAG TPA: hypothetical protein VIX82_16165 [Solirubrobacteraceae bacterium]
MPEGILAGEVGKEIAEHRERAREAEEQPAVEHADAHVARDRVLSIVEAIIPSIVALLAAWSGYSAAKWSTHSSLSLAKASATRTNANLNQIQATQIRTLDSVTFNAAETASASGNAALVRVSLRRLRPGYRPAVLAWLALHPLKEVVIGAHPTAGNPSA